MWISNYICINLRTREGRDGGSKERQKKPGLVTTQADIDQGSQRSPASTVSTSVETPASGVRHWWEGPTWAPGSFGTWVAKWGTTNSLPPEAREEACTVTKVMQYGNKHSYRAKKGSEAGPGRLIVRKYRLLENSFLFKYFTLRGNSETLDTDNDTDIIRRKATTSAGRKDNRAILWQIATASRTIEVSWIYRVKFLAGAKKKGKCTYVWAVMSCCILRSGDIETNPGPFCDSSGDEGLQEGVISPEPFSESALSVFAGWGIS